MIQNGILHQSSCVDMPSQNDVAECKNRYLLEISLLFQTQICKHLYADVISTACVFINRMPSSVIQVIVSYFSVHFGYTCFVRDVHPQLTKLGTKALKCVLLGYSRLQKRYRCFFPLLINTLYLLISLLWNISLSFPHIQTPQHLKKMKIMYWFIKLPKKYLHHYHNLRDLLILAQYQFMLHHRIQLLKRQIFLSHFIKVNEPVLILYMPFFSYDHLFSMSCFVTT